MILCYLDGNDKTVLFYPLFTLHVFAALQEWHLRGVCLVHIVGYFMPCFLMSSSLSIQLIFGLERLWYLYWSCELTDLKPETFSIACIISVVETYLCHKQLIKRQYSPEWLLCSNVGGFFPQSEPWELKWFHLVFLSMARRSRLIASACIEFYLECSCQWEQRCFPFLDQ